MEFYSYLWLRADGTPYYAGKGKERRAFVRHRLGGVLSPPPDRSRILIFPMANEAEAFESEIALIDLFGRKDLGTGCLRNESAGGENPPNWKGRKRKSFTKAHCRHLSAAKKGRNIGHPSYLTVAGIEKIRQSHIGKKMSAETKERMSESGKQAWLRRKAQGVRPL
jgi:hypothetical protein